MTAIITANFHVCEHSSTVLVFTLLRKSFPIEKAVHFKVGPFMACEVFSSHLFASFFFSWWECPKCRRKKYVEIQQVCRREKRSYMSSLEKYIILKCVNRAIDFNSDNDRCAYGFQEEKQSKTKRGWIKIQKKPQLFFTVSTPILLYGPFQSLSL